MAESADPDRIRAAWQGRISGCILGKPVEVLSFQQGLEGLTNYLERTGALPLRDYVPLVEGTLVEQLGRACCRGEMSRAEPDDDINYTVLALLLMEEHGLALETADLLAAEGIEAAIRTFYASDKKISLYVFGDEFSGNAIQPVIEAVKRINKADGKGRRRFLDGALALLEPVEQFQQLELEGNFTDRLALMEEQKSLPFAAIWDYYCMTSGVPVGSDWLAGVKQYEEDVLSQRK